jgi:hypothetical protein
MVVPTITSAPPSIRYLVGRQDRADSRVAYSIGVRAAPRFGAATTARRENVDLERWKKVGLLQHMQDESLTFIHTNLLKLRLLVPLKSVNTPTYSQQRTLLSKFRTQSV